MDQTEIVDRAIAAIGSDRKDDYVLLPTRHAEHLPDTVPALVRLLRKAKLETLARQYERLDAEAIEAQHKFTRNMTQANWAVFATATLSAATMVVGLLARPLGEGVEATLLICLGLAAVLTGAFASMWLFRVREGSLLETWMSARAAAETARLSYFTTLIREGDDGPSEIPLLLLKLEYFRRYQLDVQIAYYWGRRREHQRSAKRTLLLGGVAVALAAFASGAAGLLGAIATKWASLAAFGVVGTALASFAATREAVNQDRRNAERYGRTLATLETLRGRLDEIRAGVLAGSTDVLEEFVAAVQEQLSLEHRQWLEGGESTRSAISKLDEALTKLKQERTSIKPDEPASPVKSGS
jgi:hypothetical protein